MPRKKARKSATTKRKSTKRKSTGKWMQAAEATMEKKGTKGLFTKKAKRAGMSVQAYANYVLSHKGKFSTKTIREALFAKNAKKIAR